MTKWLSSLSLSHSYFDLSLYLSCLFSGKDLDVTRHLLGKYKERVNQVSAELFIVISRGQVVYINNQ